MFSRATERHVFKVSPHNLPRFVEKANERDSMGGNRVELIKDLGDSMLVVVAREFSYPYVIQRLKELADG